jgi:hypothetical protein
VGGDASGKKDGNGNGKVSGNGDADADADAADADGGNADGAGGNGGGSAAGGGSGASRPGLQRNPEAVGDDEAARLRKAGRRRGGYEVSHTYTAGDYFGADELYHMKKTRRKLAKVRWDSVSQGGTLYQAL